MKVSELIEQLKTMNPDAVVMLGDGDKWGEGFSVHVGVTEERPYVQGKGERVVIRDESE